MRLPCDVDCFGADADLARGFYIRYVARPMSQNLLTHVLWKLGTGARISPRSVAADVVTIKGTVGVDDSCTRVSVAASTGVARFFGMIGSEVRRNPSADLSNWMLLYGASYACEFTVHRDSTPVIQIVDPTVIEPWSAHMPTALAMDF
jgi:hypothetical protein